MSFLPKEYTLLDILGSGGEAIVYKVRHNQFGYVRALRVLNAVIARGEENENYQNSLKECKLLLRLGNGNHPNIVHINQLLLKEQCAIVEMDYVDGMDLYHYLEKKSSFVEIKDVLKLLTDISSALAYCHEDIYKFCMNKDEDSLQDDPNDGSKLLIDDKTRQALIEKYRVIHNDIHFGNIVRKEDGNYVLLDFGLSIHEGNWERSSIRKKGAPEFKAPEKWENKGELTTQSDIYSFGIVMYGFLAGRVPFSFNKQLPEFEAENLLGKAHKEQQPEPIFVLRKEAFERTHPGADYVQDYPQWLEEVIMKCLAKKPEDRFRNGKELFSYVKEHISDNSDAELFRLKKENEDLQKQVESLQNKGTGCSIPTTIGFSKEIDDLIASLQNQVKDVTTAKQAIEEKIEELRNENSTITSERDVLKEEIQTLRTQKRTNSSKWWKFTTVILMLVSFVFIYMNRESSWVTPIKSIFGASSGDDSVVIPIGKMDSINIRPIIKERDSLRNILSNSKKSTSTIIELKKQISDKEKQISELSSKVQHLNLEISDLKLKSNKGDEYSVNAIADRDKTINQLRSQIKTQNQQIIEKNKLIDVLNKQIGVN